MTVDEFERALGNFGQRLQDIGPTLQSIAELIQIDLRASYIASGLKTGGPLETSLRVTADGNTLSINMLDYGMYNNYGVLPTPSFKNGGDPVKQTYFGRMFSYKTRQFGLPSRQFFDYENIQQQLADQIAIEITDNF